MDCNTGMRLGNQFNKDAMMMQGGMPMGNMQPGQDALLNANAFAPMDPQMAQQWAAGFQQQQQQQAVMQREMEQAFQQQQHLQRQGAVTGMPGPQQMAAGPSPLAMQQQQQAMNAMMMQGMMASNMGFGMAMPRTQYQPSLNMSSAFQQQQETAAPMQSVNLSPAQVDSAWADQLGNQQWNTDYSDVQQFNAEGQQDQSVTEKTKDSAFYKFMDQVRNKEILIDEEKGEVVEGPGPDVEVEGDTEHIRQWAESEGIHMPESVYQPQPPVMQGLQPGEEPYTQDLDMGDNDVEEWAKEYAEMQQRLQKAANSTDYPFEPNNAYLEHDAPFEAATEMLELGNLAEAALALEAVCQKDNENERAWQLLGTTQAENEKDNLAILALNNARKLNPRNLEVHAALSVSHTNERNSDAAMDALKAWVVNHPEYEALGSITVEADPQQDISDTFFFADPTRMREVRTLYESAIEMNNTDAQLFTNLGVLYNVAHEFDKAADCFQRGVAVRGQDAKLWNKLGATLANGGHPERALEAYNHALDINPGYVRAMYNMAVAYSNMSQYPMAARQIVKAIATQQGGTNPSGEGSIIATRNMWDLLRMTLNLMDREDLVEVARNEDLTPFIKEFGLELHV